MEHSFEQVAAARAAIAARTSLAPRVGMILGSGMSDLADNIEEPTTISYHDIPGFLASSVEGHRSELALGWLGGQPVAVMRGRSHFYEGYTMQQITFPVRVMHALGCHTLIVTNAAGGLHATWQVGDIMHITDQIFLPGLAGNHPLRGRNDERLGVRFPAMLDAYTPALGSLAHTVATQQGLTLRRGVYVMISGPSFESGAELRMLRLLGGDAVGMSTAPEVVVARHSGMNVLGLSLITNLALPEGSPANHAEVLEAGIAARPPMTALLQGVLSGMHEPDPA
ncbi:MAG: purine-nucleoside phosphorylase [Chloroflexaceae bacterium]|nr:purine-nucleoside phosphorylase [Chloroflexaceae bacterium]NJO07209.1 purine-nucleoside phosphorylase [Chloroflexaceae bacterium]